MPSLSPEAAEKALTLKLEHECLFFVSIDGDEILFRPLTIREVKIVSESNNLEPWVLHDWIIKRAILYHSKGIDWLLNDSIFSMVDRLAISILESSTIKDDKGVMERLHTLKNTNTDLVSVIEDTLVSVFGLTWDKIQNLTLQRCLQMVAAAERITGQEWIKLKANKPSSKEPPIPRGFNSTGGSKIDFEAENRAMMGA